MYDISLYISWYKDMSFKTKNNWLFIKFCHWIQNVFETLFVSKKINYLID